VIRASEFGDKFKAENEASDAGCPLSLSAAKVVSPIEKVVGSAAQPVRDEGGEEEEEEEENSDAHFKRKWKDTSPREAPKTPEKEEEESGEKGYVAPFVVEEGESPYIPIAISPVADLHDIGEFTKETTVMSVSCRDRFTFLHFHSFQYHELILSLTCRRRI